MKKIRLIVSFLLLIFSIPQIVEADNKTTYTYLQGDSTLGGGFMLMMEKLPAVMQQNAPFIDDAKALAAIFMIIFFAVKSYGMMVGDSKLEIIPLLRPFALCIVILWWGVFCNILQFPTTIVANKTYDLWNTEQGIVDNLRLTRADMMITLGDSLYTFQAQTQVAAKQSDNLSSNGMDMISSAVKSAMGAVLNPVMELKNRMEIGLQLLLSQALEILSLWILRIAVFIIFGLQIIYSTILYILGPFAVAASILPAFRDSFTTWIARYISVNLYKGIAYLILWIMGMIQEFAFKSEIAKFQDLLGTNGTGTNLQKLAWFTSNGILSFGEVIIAFVITAACMFTVPSISTWIISTSGISSAASNLGRGTQAVAATAKKAVTAFL